MIYQWNDRISVLNNHLVDFYEQHKFCDINLKIAEGPNSVPIQCHSIVLCAFSELFAENFRKALNKNELNMSPHFLTEHALTVKSIIDFMYSGSIELTLENVEVILRAAFLFKIQILVDVCIEFMKNNIRDSIVLFWLDASTALNISGLKTRLLEFINDHFEEVLLYANSKQLESMLSKNDSISEDDVFKNIVKWINHDVSNRENLAYELLKKVRFKLLTLNTIFEYKKHINTFKNNQIHELILDWLEWFHFHKNQLISDQKSNTSERIPHEIATSETIEIPKKKSKVNDFSKNAMKLMIVQISDSYDIGIQVYQPETKSWSLVRQRFTLPKYKKDFSTIVVDGKLIFVGGIDKNGSRTNSVECMDLHAFIWTDMPPMNKSRDFPKLAYSNEILFVLNESEDTNSDLALELFNFSQKQWIVVKLPSSSFRFTKKVEITSYNGILYVLDYLNGHLQIYDARCAEWTSKSIAKDLVVDFGFVAIKNLLYVIGGNVDTAVKCFNLSDDKWSELVKLPSSALDNIKTAVFETKIIICANGNNNVIVEAYDPETDSWSSFGSLKPSGTFKISNICVLRTKAS